MSNKKAKKKPRNKFRDVMWDYYNTNKQISKENAERSKGQEKPKGLRNLSGTEKTYIAVIVLGIIGIVVKYVIF